MMDTYPWHNITSFHPSMQIMYQLALDGTWSEVRQFATISMLRSRRCQLSLSESCPKHPWLFSCNRTDKVAQVGRTIEDCLPSEWKERGIAYVRWWIETRAADHDWRAVQAVQNSLEAERTMLRANA